MGPLCTWSGKVKIRESDVPELNKHILNIIMIMVKNFIIKIITSLVKVQMLQQGVNTPLEEEAMLLPFQESPLPPPSPPRGLVLTAPCPHKVAGVSARARQGEGRLPAGLSPWQKAKGRMQTPAQMERHLHTFYIIYKETGIPGNMISTPNALPD